MDNKNYDVAAGFHPVFVILIRTFELSLQRVIKLPLMVIIIMDM